MSVCGSFGSPAARLCGRVSQQAGGKLAAFFSSLKFVEFYDFYL